MFHPLHIIALREPHELELLVIRGAPCHNLISQALEFNGLNEIGVPLQVILTIQFASLRVLVMFFYTDLFLLYDAV